MFRNRRACDTAVHPPIDPSGRSVIVVDDGIATGASMIAAIHSIRVKQPKKIIAVAPYETLQRIQESTDEVVCLYVPKDFYAVGDFFQEFSQVTDEEAIALLQQGRSNSEKTKSMSEVSP